MVKEYALSLVIDSVAMVMLFNDYHGTNLAFFQKNLS